MHHNCQSSRSPKEEKLQELLLFFFEIFPKEQTKNLFFEINLNQYPSKYSHLHKLLTHFFTLIYQNNRIMENNTFITQREDVLASLQILEIISLEAYRNQNEIIEDCYQKLKSNSKPNQELPRKFIEGIIQKRKSQTNRIINAMLEKGYLELTGGYKNRGFIYRIITKETPQEITKSPIYLTPKEVDIFDDFTDFKDNENIEYQYRKDNFRF